MLPYRRGQRAGFNLSTHRNLAFAASRALRVGGRNRSQAPARRESSSANPDRPPLVEIDYTYDRSSNRLTRTDARPGASWADRDFRYAYDGLDRLVQADRGAEGGSWSAAAGGQKWALDMLGNWDSIFNDSNGDGNYTSSDPDEQQERTHNFANEIEEITNLPFAYDAAGNMTEQGLPAATTKKYTHDAWNRLVKVRIDEAVLGEYEYNALHWRTVKRLRSAGAGSLDEMRLMYYSANWQLLEERIDRSWTSGFTEDERAQTFWGKRYIDDAVARRRDRDANGTFDDSFFYVTDAQFSTVAMAKPNGGIVERTTYDAYGKARHHFGADVTGDGATTSADGTAIQNAYGQSIGDAGYKAEYDLDRDGDIDTDDYNAGIALSGGVTQSALASGMVSFVSTGSGGSTRHGPDNPIAWDGYVFNAETGQYYVRFRWYDPILGRWLERDPMGYVDGLSIYIFARNNPSFGSDPFGLDSKPVPFDPHNAYGVFFDIVVECPCDDGSTVEWDYGDYEWGPNKHYTKDLERLFDLLRFDTQQLGCRIKRFSLNAHHGPGFTYCESSNKKAVSDMMFISCMDVAPGAEVNLNMCNSNTLALAIISKNKDTPFTIEFTVGQNLDLTTPGLPIVIDLSFLATSDLGRFLNFLQEFVPFVPDNWRLEPGHRCRIDYLPDDTNMQELLDQFEERYFGVP